MLDIDITLAVQILNFFGLLLVLNAILYRPLRKIMQERSEMMGNLDREIESLKKSANQKLEDLKAKLQDANLKGNKEREGLKNEALAEEKQLTVNAREEAEAYKAKVASEVEQDVSKARTELKGQISVFASEIATKILGRAI
ncbi:MAG: ATP synthase F0 subunit B [Pseudomonadota bacterium]